MFSQISQNLLMIRPQYFKSNQETFSTNCWQNNCSRNKNIETQALSEFDSVLDLLSKHEINVSVINNNNPETPDAVFPNNWISSYENGLLVLHPMMAKNRRKEKRKDIIELLQKKFKVTEIIDWSHHEQNNQFLEGTGSMVLDRANQVIYACLSSRTNINLLTKFSKLINYEYISFRALVNGQDCYHTNIIMSIGENFAIICTDVILPNHTNNICKKLAKTHEMITISKDEMNHFCGNVLQVKNKHGDPFLVISQKAYDYLSEQKKEKIEQYCNFIVCSIPTIETYGGGGIRCMIAEIFLAKK